MALRMARPIKRGTSANWLLKVRVPSDIIDKVQGHVVLPIGGRRTPVAISAGYVEVSLRTSDPDEAALRYAEAHDALLQHWKAVKTGPKPVSKRQAVALSADAYRERISEIDDASMVAEREAMNAEFDEFIVRRAETESEERDQLVLGWFEDVIAEQGVDFIAVIAALLPGSFPADQEDLALESRYGARVDAALALRGAQCDDASRPSLLKEFRRAELAGSKALGRMLEGDFSDEEKPAYFPPFEPPQPPVAASARVQAPASEGGDGMSIAQLFKAMREAMLEFVKPSTLRRYQSTIEKLSAFTDHADFRTLTRERVKEWIKHRTTEEGISKKTVRNNDLVAVQSVLNFATTDEGGERLKKNPIQGLTIKLPRASKTKHERRLYHEEIVSILKAANAVEIGGRYPKSSAGNRWTPWLAAYSGARIQELVSLEAEHIRNEGGAWVMDLTKTKMDEDRTVPLHEHVIAIGFLDYVRSVGKGPLFIDPPEVSGRTEAASRDASEVRASGVAVFMRSKAKLRKNVDPNHGWRGTWKSIAASLGIEERYRDAITGHTPGSVGRKYEAPTTAELVEVMQKFRRYAV
ncbi:phage integrase family protein [Bosea sp. 124]|nr:phage integrase family protein [Bosea sp. 124]